MGNPTNHLIYLIYRMPHIIVELLQSTTSSVHLAHSHPPFATRLQDQQFVVLVQQRSPFSRVIEIYNWPKTHPNNVRNRGTVARWISSNRELSGLGYLLVAEIFTPLWLMETNFRQAEALKLLMNPGNYLSCNAWGWAWHLPVWSIITLADWWK